ncbi:MAG: 2,3-diketo-5-methylthiopentyl-1-phosphate enolase [bacterium]|nr:2,3-diketo-5-methylthiopentyl-1-phosphate enolase [bacterium]
MYLNSKLFTIKEGINQEDYIIGIYHLETATDDILKKVEALALEQSTGTWTKVPEETEDVIEKFGARVLGLYEIPNYEDALPENKVRNFVFMLGFPVVNINGQIPQVLTALYGNISMAGKLKLLDIHFPLSYIKNYNGPKFGVEGMRKLLKVKDRPLVMVMFKPCVGLAPKALGKMFFELGMAGVDIIKDDELLADPDYCTVPERLEICLKMTEKIYSETGRKVLYSVNITDNHDRMFEKAHKAIKNGANSLMVNTYTVGFSAMSALAEDKSINVPILSHPDFAGAMFESPNYGLSSNLVLGKLARLSGADMVVYPSHYGKVLMLKERIIRIAQELLSPFYHLNRVFPCPSAGIHAGLIGKLMNDVGTDILIGAGGGVHGHPMGLKAGVKAFHQAIEAEMKNIPLEKACQKNKELNAAIQKWGVVGDKSKGYDLAK